jgi:hypothetical protein
MSTWISVIFSKVISESSSKLGRSVRCVSPLKYLACASYSLSLLTSLRRESKFSVIFSLIYIFILRLLALLANMRVESVSPRKSLFV